MRTIMTLNSKGGCGKSTLATNLATFFAGTGNQVVLADCDPQGSSMNWLTAREQYEAPAITGYNAVRKGLRVADSPDVVIMDAPAGVHGSALTSLVRHADTLILPVLPSPLDIRAAARFIEELLTVGKVSRKETRLAVVANRVREHTVIYQTLEAFLSSLKIPFIGTLRDTQNYIRAAELGLGIFEMAPSAVGPDLDQWRPILRWLKKN
jgi:chromosome partitioning protein